MGCITESEHLPSGLGYYGLPVRESLSTVVHPNELLDGAVTGSTMKTIAYSPTTWDWQNQPLALGVSREHGRRLDFAGVVLQRIRFESFREKEVAAHNAAQVARALGAEAALVTWIGSGNAFLEVMLTVQACEQKGIKTVLVTYEYGGKDGVDSPLLFYDAAADAVVSTGSRDLAPGAAARGPGGGGLRTAAGPQLPRRPRGLGRRRHEPRRRRRHYRRHRPVGRPGLDLPGTLRPCPAPFTSAAREPVP